MPVMSDVSDKLEKNLHIKNDVKHTSDNKVLSEADQNANPSLSFYSLLIAATIICSLGLLLDSPAVIIGGMLISPLMWPLMKISLGIVVEDKKRLFQALKFMILIVFISIISAALITLLSPIKLVSQEISARTNPTVLDLIIALSAGFIASLAVLKDKISDRIAGVAITTSLTPPLCVAGIGLALQNTEIASGGFILFFANTISIIFISTLVFSYSGFREKARSKIRKKGILIVSLVLLLTAIPLAYYLRRYTFQVRVYEKSVNIIKESLLKKSQQISIKNVRTEIKRDGSESIIFIEADIIVPEGVNIDYQQRDEIVNYLRSEFGSEINMSLNIQRSISIATREERRYEKISSDIKQKFSDELAILNPKADINNIEVSKEGDLWKIDSSIRVDPENNLSTENRNLLKTRIEEALGIQVDMDLVLTPLLDFSTSKEEAPQGFKEDIESLISTAHPNSKIQSITIESISENLPAENGESENYSSNITSVVELYLPSTETLNIELITREKEILQEKYDANIDLKFNLFGYYQQTL